MTKAEREYNRDKRKLKALREEKAAYGKLAECIAEHTYPPSAAMPFYMHCSAFDAEINSVSERVIKYEREKESRLPEAERAKLNRDRLKLFEYVFLGNDTQNKTIE